MAVQPLQSLNLDGAQIRDFNSFFRGLPEKPATTIRFFNRVDFYTVHGEDATFTAKELYKTTSFIKTYTSGDDSLDSLVINKANFEAFVRELLLVKHYRIEVYVKKVVSKGTTWNLEYKGSPGNLSEFEDLLFENVEKIESSSIIAIRLGNDANTSINSSAKVVGIALINTVDRTMSVCEFVDDEYYSCTEALIVHLAPKECLIQLENTVENENLKKIVQRSGVLITSLKKSDFNKESAIQDLNRLISFQAGQHKTAASFPQTNLDIAISCLASLIKYLDLLSNPENFGVFSLETLEHQKFVQIDSAAVSALNLLPLAPSTMQNKHHSLLGLLDRTRTSHGKRLLVHWVRQPLKDLNLINERLDVVEWLVDNTEARQELYDEHLRRVPDFQALARRLQRKKATLQDCYKLYMGVLKLPDLLRTITESGRDHKCYATIDSVFAIPLKDRIDDFVKYQEMMEATIDFTLVDKGEFLIRPDFDDDLKDFREKMDRLILKMKKELSRIASKLGLQENKTVKLESNGQHGYHFRVTLKDGKLVNSVKECQVLDTHKGGVRFTNEKLTEINSEYTDIYKQYITKQDDLLTEVIKIAIGYCDSFQSTSYILALLDGLVSFAMTAVCAPIPYVRPTMMPMNHPILRLKQARHPCVEMQDSISYIPNDVFFKQGESTLSIITGPNMSGKSTYIRSVGAIALMCHIGSFVPCESAEVPVMDAILARVGANDSQLKGMSTFMVEMVETSGIIRRATKNSLVIIDELGRGTSTYEGCGIASAIVEHLATESKSYTMFATHFHELTLLPRKIPTIRNLHVSAITELDRLVHMYQVKDGPCDKSFGIHVARMAKIPQHVIKEAECVLEELEGTMSVEATDEIQQADIIQDGHKIIVDFLRNAKEKYSQSPKSFTEKEFNELKLAAINSGNAMIRSLIN